MALATTDEALEAAFPEPDIDAEDDMDEAREEVTELTAEEAADETEAADEETAPEADERDPVLLLRTSQPLKREDIWEIV